MARGRSIRALGAVAAALALLGLGTPAVPALAVDGPAAEEQAQSVPLRPELEQIRAAEAVELYGSPEIRPVAERKTSLISLGDSEISGEGVGTYEPGTDGPDNWCHRSPDAAIHRTGIAADVTYNAACSGASSVNIRIGGSPQYADELVQSDSLAITARNTRLKQIVLVAGANDDLQFGPVITDCVTRWFLLQGPCAPGYGPGWQDRVDGLVPKVTATIDDLRTVMRDAGYARDDYALVVMSYPSPIGPDIKDNPNYPGKLAGGCTGYTSDSQWGRDEAVPLFQQGIRAAARQTGATYLDTSRLFHGHEVCMENPFARGLYVELSNPFPPDSNSVRQSFHPNAPGHGAFASCLTQLAASGLAEASCADPDGRGQPQLYPGAWDDAFAPLRNAATGTCLDADGASSRDGTTVRGWSCHGERNQGWWHDPEGQRLHTELTHDRCLDVPAGRYEAGAGLILWNCHTGDNQRFVRGAGASIRPAAAPELCVTLGGATEQVRLQRCDGSAAQRFA
ncbi:MULTISPECIES: ricin-type beta-trefoil lectin domain protein [unclassified Streptomyces]|uniref:ricin-type beta-trefoil lectin domain protein n=1 Tax=unclassified Streptomyces TaxID=2593676 RepID=UPI0022B6DCC0|nr:MULTISPECIES: ricin-type beta-trefoil lectin domain protein [unclassified Streptomyces]MCZ7415381.1 ricin-type beta-trefoil lectin domain protein [Streptomyces sp. WMMC897]MCZ7432303.1 ricin-type beta-trefoil lectin domain protein [Streptomyces sp. WMMC1477]